MLVADPPGEFQNQAKGDAGGRIAERAGPAHGDAALGRCRHVDRGIARTGGDEQLEIGQCFDGVTAERRALAHHADNVKVPQSAMDLVWPAHWPVEYRDLNLRRDLFPFPKLQRHVLIVVEYRTAIVHPTPLVLNYDPASPTSALAGGT